MFLWVAIIFPPIWMSKQCNRKWQSSLPLSEGSLFWNWFQFGCVFQDGDGRVRGMRPSFCGRREHNREERGPCSTVWNVFILWGLWLCWLFSSQSPRFFSPAGQHTGCFIQSVIPLEVQAVYPPNSTWLLKKMINKLTVYEFDCICTILVLLLLTERQTQTKTEKKSLLNYNEKLWLMSMVWVGSV